MKINTPYAFDNIHISDQAYAEVFSLGCSSNEQSI